MSCEQFLARAVCEGVRMAETAKSCTLAGTRQDLVVPDAGSASQLEESVPADSNLVEAGG